MTEKKTVEGTDETEDGRRKTADTQSRAKEAEQRDEDELEEGLEESFPGSDAPASTMRHEK